MSYAMYLPFPDSELCVLRSMVPLATIVLGGSYHTEEACPGVSDVDLYIITAFPPAKSRLHVWKTRMEQLYGVPISLHWVPMGALVSGMMKFPGKVICQGLYQVNPFLQRTFHDSLTHTTVLRIGWRHLLQAYETKSGR